MRGWIFVVWAAGLTAWGQQTSPAPQPSSTNAYTASQPADPFADLTATWLQQHDPKLRLQAAQELVDAAIHDQTGADDTSVVENVARDDKPAHVIDPPAAQKITLHPVLDLGFTYDTTSQNGQPRPVFRRIANHRFEIWIPHEGWLFDVNGKLLTHVTVPRKDGDGREWYGAFLPNGMWVTTDLWEHDKELNCFDTHGKWKWTLKGDKLRAGLPKIPGDTDLGPIVNTFNWARATKDGQHWLVSVGGDLNSDEAIVDRHGKVVPLPEKVGLWQLVYPRAMGPRGVYNHVYIASDDNKIGLHRDEPAHGPECGWSTYGLSGYPDDIRLSAENNNLGFWPGSHDVFIVDDHDSGTQKTWFFDSQFGYQGEMDGTYFADAANGHDLLVLGTENQLIEVARTSSTVKATGARQFNWPDGILAVPTAVYDDLHVGFFTRGNSVSLATW
jgi:hypothetical protein